MATQGTRQQQQPFNSNLYDQKCVSQICQCGNHKCPPQDFERAVKFQQPILQKDALRKCKSKCKKPKKKCACKCKGKHQGNQHVYQQRHYDPQSIQTVYQVDFQGKYVEQDQLKRTNGNGNTGVFQHGNNTPFIGNTQYNTQFVGKLVQNDRLACTSKTLHVVQPRPPFDGATTYNTSYIGKYVQKQHPVNLNKVIERPHVPFDGTTEYNSHYQYKVVQNDGAQCESCCGCVSDQCSSCYDCQSVDSLDRINTNYKHQQDYPTAYHAVQSVYPQHPPQQVIPEQAFKKTQPNTNNCPVKKLPPVPKKCSPGKSHTKFSSKKNIWR